MQCLLTENNKKIDVNRNVKVGHAAVYSGEMDMNVEVEDALDGWGSEVIWNKIARLIHSHTRQWRPGV